MNTRERLTAWLWLVIALSFLVGPEAARLDDGAPRVDSVWPVPDATGVAADATLTVVFSEPVTLGDTALWLGCERSDIHAVAITGDGQSFTFTPTTPFFAGETCTADLRALSVTDLDSDDPPDAMLSDFAWAFQIAPAVLINEIDAITADEAAEFVELFDGGGGQTPLDGLALVFYRGDRLEIYATIDLGGYRTDGRGYFVAGGQAVNPDHRLAHGMMLDGPDAVALYAGPASRYPRGTPLTLDGLLEAVVYAPEDSDPAGLLPLLLPGQSPTDEEQHGAAATESAQRLPDGSGAPRQTSTFAIAPPTPHERNQRTADDAPRVTTAWPADGATGVPADVQPEINFSEPVNLYNQPFAIGCSHSGSHGYAISGHGAAYRLVPYVPLQPGETCTVSVYPDRLGDVDDNDPPDGLNGLFTWSFTVAQPVAESVLINEIDADTAGSDKAELIELYDGGAGHTSLDGLLIVLFNGSDDRSYRTIDLSGHATDGAGYFLLGSAAITGADLTLPDGALQNGPDATALIGGQAAAYPNGTPVDEVTSLDAVVYGAESDAGLLSLLNSGQPVVNEAGRGDAEGHSNQRCPNGAGGMRNTAAYRQNMPTPRAPSVCVTDSAPAVTERVPAPGATGISLSASITIVFSEPVAVSDGWLTIACAISGTHDYAKAGGPSSFVLQPTTSFTYAETCTLTLKAQRVHDLDADDPPDSPNANLTWKFTTTGAPPADLLINEIDPDTAGSDTAEFVELYDGGRGNTPLDGLVLVFFNGYAKTSYRALDLDDQRTDANGYWLAGNVAVGPDLVFVDGGLQNGPDAVALYAADATDFPTDTPLSTAGLLDAVVYGDPAGAAGLLPLLFAGETAADEGARGAPDQHALQRCPNGTGGQRRTSTFRPNNPTPGAANVCTADTAPAVSAVTPADGATQIAINSTLAIAFSEPVTVAAAWLRLRCGAADMALTIAPNGATAFTATPAAPLPAGATCRATIAADRVRDADSDDPPDLLPADFAWSFTTAVTVADFVLINEIDSDTPGSDTAEFIELYDGGIGHTDLSGLALVLFNGQNDRGYYAIDLDGVGTDEDGFAVIGGPAVTAEVTLPAAIIQNGPDAAALFAGDAQQYPNGTVITTANLLDAVVYGTADATDAGLLALLAPGQGQIDEAARDAADTDSSQRCPDGAGGPRHTAAYRQNSPTPGATNDCRVDDPPAITAVAPARDAGNVATDATITVTFSEAVAVESGWIDLTCAGSGVHMVSTSGGPISYIVAHPVPFARDERCTASLHATAVHDADAIDPPDNPAADFSWSFRTAVDPAEGILINELDADSPGSDTAEFIELYDGGRGHTGLAGLVLVFYNGKDDRAYFAIDLNGVETDAGGFAVIGGPGLAAELALPAAIIQNGPDAVALYAGNAADFPPGTALTTTNLRDAIVYGTDDASDAGLLSLLAAGEAQVDEAARGAAEENSSQRCPDGAGGPRHTAAYRQNTPTPGAANDCRADDAPAIVVVAPADDATGVAPGAPLTVTFSEAVALDAGWLTIACATSGRHDGATDGGPTHYTFTPAMPFAPDETCTATLRAAAVHDADAIDPPDNPAADFVWRFHTAPAVADGILINEFDSDTPGNDQAQFIELSDGGVGGADLSGLVIVFWNGQDDRAYAAIDLDGQHTDATGRFVVGDATVEGVDWPLPAALQNGPDAIALYAGDATAFPTGAPLTLDGLRDAVVYGPADEPDGGLLALLAAGQPQLDESAGNDAPAHALQRCPDATGHPRHTAAYRPAAPTPGQPNACLIDAPPAVTSTRPAAEASDVALTATLTITFSEPVALGGGWITLACDGIDQPLTTLPGETVATAIPAAPLPPGTACVATVWAAAVSDRDGDDPPDRPAADTRWAFTTAAAPPVLVASFTTNSPVWVDEPVIFTNTSRGPAATRYLWDFGDGTWATTTHPRHRYPAPGPYTVTLTVTATTTATATAEVVARARLVLAPVVLGSDE